MVELAHAISLKPSELPVNPTPPPAGSVVSIHVAPALLVEAIIGITDSIPPAKLTDPPTARQTEVEVQVTTPSDTVVAEGTDCLAHVVPELVVVRMTVVPDVDIPTV